MAEYRLTGPDGVKYKVTAPEGTSEADLIAFVTKNAPPPMEMESTTNIPRLVGESAVRGVTNLVGLPGTIGDVANTVFDKTLGPAYQATVGRGIRAAKEAITGQPSVGSTAPRSQSQLSVEGLQRMARSDGIIGSPDAIPQTTGERYLAKAVEGAASSPFGIPAAIAGAVGGMGAELGGSSVPQEYQQLGQLVGGLAGGVTGAMASGAAETGVRRLITPLPSRLGPEEARIAALAQQAGIRLTPGQATGNEGMQTIERSLAQLPLSSAAQKAVYDQQRTAFNDAVLRRAGVNADRATPDVLDSAFGRIGQTFDRLAARTQVRVDPQLEQSVQQVVANYGRRLDTSIAPKFNSYVDDIEQAITAAKQPGVTNVTIDGRTFQNIHSDIAREARAAGANPDLQRALNGLSKALDDAMERSMPAGAREAWRDARRDYRNLLTVDKAMQGGPAGDRLAGNIPPGAFNAAVRQMDPRGYARGRGEYNDLARVGQFLSDRIPDSGTARRSYTMGLLTGAPVGTGGSAAMLGASPGGALATAAVTAAIPPLAQRILNSNIGRAYLQNQALPGAATGVGAFPGGFLGALPPAERMAQLLLADRSTTAGQR